MSNDIFNFSAGPAVIPKTVLEKIHDGLDDFDRGMSITEVSHRSEAFKNYAQSSEDSLRSLLSINDEYSILFLQGGATHQFALIPMNFGTETGSLDYLVTGAWSKKASAYASSIANVNVVSDSSSNNFTDISDSSTWTVNDRADYFFYCANETVHGLEIHEPIESESPLICDMSSTIASRPIDIKKYDLIFAGAQKNLGIAGVTILIIKRNLLSRVNKGLLPILDYSKHAEDVSMLNTSPVFAWYVSGLIFDWIRDQGGVETMAKLNQEKSTLLYNFIDQSSFYSNPVSRSYRSWMNIPFILSRNDLDDEFIKSAEDSGLLNLKGHRTVGGMRASVYNAMPIEGVKKLISFMDEFAKLHE